MTQGQGTTARKLVLVGNPNVGKSVIFRLLTGNYVLVSNFPGTTVEISRGRMQVGTIPYEVVDTPGVYSLVPQSEDERVTCEILLRERPDVILQVADAKNLRRTLLLALQLSEFGIPMVLVLNMMDEAEERGIEIDRRGLSDLLRVPVVQTIAVHAQGKRQFLQAIENATVPANPMLEQPPWRTLDHGSPQQPVPAALAAEWLDLDDPAFSREIRGLLGDGGLSRLEQARESYREEHNRTLDRDIAESRNRFLDEYSSKLKTRREVRFVDRAAGLRSRAWLALLIAGILFFAWNEFGPSFGLPTPYGAVVEQLNSRADDLAPLPTSRSLQMLHAFVFGQSAEGLYEFGLFPAFIHFCFFIAPVLVPVSALLLTGGRFSQELAIWSRHPLTGIPILILVLLLVYEFVGFTGAQTLVGLIEEIVFGGFLIPVLQQILPEGFLHEFLLGKYGMISMGLSYAIAIVLPVVGTFFIAFSLLEDSGYIPRLSILADRVLRLLGLNGKAALPMVLGLGCCTMATLTTRILHSPKERLIATMLLALGIPCSAQLGVILGISASFSPWATLTVLGVVASQLLLVGFLASQLIRGERSPFILEIPPIRVPILRNVLLKTWYRIRWYLTEAVPLFLYGTLALFLLDVLAVRGATLLEWLERGLEPVLTGILHIPSKAAGVFVMGFLRRDYGAAGLFDMVREGMMTAPQAVVSLIVITLFVPCLASFLVIVKEQGLRRAVGITTFIVPFAISVGAVVSWVFRTFGVRFQ